MGDYDFEKEISLYCSVCDEYHTLDQLHRVEHCLNCNGRIHYVCEEDSCNSLLEFSKPMVEHLKNFGVMKK